MLLISAPLPDLTSEQGIHYPKYGHPNGFPANLHFLFHFFGPQLKAWSKTVCKHLAMTNQRNGKENYLILVRRQIKLRILFTEKANSVICSIPHEIWILCSRAWQRPLFSLLNQQFVYTNWKDHTLEDKWFSFFPYYILTLYVSGSCGCQERIDYILSLDISSNRVIEQAAKLQFYL